MIKGRSLPAMPLSPMPVLRCPMLPGQLASAVIFRNLATGEVTASDTRHGSGHWFAWRPDGRRFATTGTDQFVRVWDWPTLELVAEQRIWRITRSPPISPAMEAARSWPKVPAASSPLMPTVWPRGSDDSDGLGPYGHGSQSGQPDGNKLHEWYDFVFVDLDQGRVLRRGKIDFGPFPGGYGEFSPDGRRVAVVQGPGARMDVATGDWLGPPVPAHVQSISYAPDGSTFATGGETAPSACGMATPVPCSAPSCRAP